MVVITEPLIRKSQRGHDHRNEEVTTHDAESRARLASSKKTKPRRSMGNCIVLEKKVIKIIKTDGEVLEYKAPTKVHEVLSKYGGHAISDALPAIQYLHKDAVMVGGRIYYLLPLSVVPPQTPKKKVKFADPVVDAGQGSTGVVRIKLVISKQELRALLQKGGIAVDNMVPEFQKEEKMNGTGSFGPDCEMNSTGWNPALESIPERN